MRRYKWRLLLSLVLVILVLGILVPPFTSSQDSVTSPASTIARPTFGTPMSTSKFNPPSASTPTPFGRQGDWTLVFADEFDGVNPDGTGLDTTKWVTCYWYAARGGSEGCGEDHAQSWHQPQNVVVANGSLHLVARQETVVGTDNRTYNYTTGMVTSGRIGWWGPPKFHYRYGYAEIRAKVPGTPGFWPAFWSLVQAVDNEVYPLPEIDTTEILTREPATSYMTYHGPDGSESQSTPYSITAGSPDFSQAYHIFASEWRPGEIIWYVDGVEVKRWQHSRITDLPMYLLLTMPVGKDWSWSGGPTAATGFPSEFEIDYVRVWQRAPSATPDALLYLPLICKEQNLDCEGVS